MLGPLRRGGVLCFVLDCLFVTGERGDGVLIRGFSSFSLLLIFGSWC